MDKKKFIDKWGCKPDEEAPAFVQEIDSKNHAEFLEDLDQFENHIKDECIKEADSVQNPYPESVFTMNTDGYVKAIPDEHLRTAISGYCGRIFFDIAKKEIVKTIRDKE